MRNIKTQQLRYFVAVYNVGSITAAAHQVNATQSGVSMQIREFEDRVGMPLFERNSAGVVPTKMGDLVYRRAIRVLREMDELQNDVSAHRGHLVGSVRAGIMPTFARSVLGPTLMEFSEKFPYVDVQISEGYSETLTRRVADEELDFAVVPAGPLPVGIRSSHVDTDLELLVESNLDGKATDGFTHLATAPPLNLVLPGTGNARRKGIDQYLENTCQSKHAILQLDSMMTTFDLLERGNYASILPGCLCISKFDDPKAKLSPIRDPILTVDYLLIEPETRAKSTATSAFGELLCHMIRKSCADVRERFSVA
ncbi:LysR family transcriptional regulator [Yoonia sp. I 8.24]|uniref:LysR family transcriptional regulator n=1 Tax=Yoonia sp. I 8.24 TaxID=1537229 RepID=UPI001EE06E93|nr:LysR family transcriptional regulator [Yoonia sp. I 8.24]MCG3268074.1 LysR family transcriptional regulator [Yoonia sp. I 8.24]